MNKLFKLPLTIAAVAVLCCTALFFAFADDTSDSYDLSQVTEDMLSDMGGVATLVIQSENDVYITGGDECDFAVSVSAPHTTIQLTDEITSIFSLDVTGDLLVTGGELIIRGDGPALTLSDSAAVFTGCNVTAKSLKSGGAVLSGSSVSFEDSGRLTVTGANAGVTAESGSFINIANSGVFKAYSVHSFALKTSDDSALVIEDGVRGKVFLCGNTKAVFGNVDISADVFMTGDIYRDPAAFIVTDGEKIDITIDPGHGGYDPGSVYAAQQYPTGSSSYNFYLEKNLTLTVGQYLKSYLEQSDRLRINMTRDGDEWRELADRCMSAYEHNADILISLHFNYDPAHVLTGASAYISQFDRYRLEGFAEAILENLGDLGLNDLGAIVRLDTELDGDPAAWWDLYDNIRTDEVDTGTYCDYYGIVNGSGRIFAIPVLLEHLHLQDSGDMALIQDEAGLAALARADADAFISYFRISDLIPDEELTDALFDCYKLADKDDSLYTAQSFADSVAEYMLGLDALSGSDEFSAAARDCILK